LFRVRNHGAEFVNPEFAFIEANPFLNKKTGPSDDNLISAAMIPNKEAGSPMEQEKAPHPELV